ncbi:MAG TPA: NAD(P)/FAD-dependent oxidoreductase [Mycobacteriales bacterium]|nr:NAD(P)/FAD-dependent oxidoreductase [Mycobacteriales bacterium]
MPSIHSALIIGGGIAGPVAGAALRKAGIDATVYEAYPAPSDGIGGALALEPNGLAALDLIGAADAVRAAAIPIARSVMSIAGTPRGKMPSLPGLEPRRAIDRGSLHRILQENAAAAGVRFEYGKRLVAVDESSNGVTARFADGSEASADILIGADGVRSTVRRLIDPQAPGADYTGMLGFEGLVDVDLNLPPETMTFAFGRRAYYLYWVRPDGRISWGANLPSPQYRSLTDARAVPKEQWLSTLRETYREDTPGGLLAERTTAENLQVTGALHIMPPVPHWYRDRLVLVGDAVHAPSNSTGQGASQAIESAIQLARCLRDLPDPSSAFRTYEHLRRDRVERITRRGAKINKSKTPGPLAQKIMPALMPLMFKMMNLEKIMATELRYTIDWNAPVG